MGMFSENYSGDRCSDCTWADNMENKLELIESVLKDMVDSADNIYDFELNILANRIKCWVEKLRVK